jgi:hypothetical protein
MTEIIPPETESESKTGKSHNKMIRGILNAASGAIPFAGGLLSAAASHWSETEQERAMEALRSWIKMLEDELREKQSTILEIIARLDMHDEEIAKRVQSKEYQSLLKKAFRQWAGTESQQKQEYIRNILSNAAATRIVTDDVINLFIDWLATYSEFHFAVIGEIYRRRGTTRGEIWESLGKGTVREDSAEADLFKLLIRDLSTGGIIRQHRETDYAGNYVRKNTRPAIRGNSGLKSAFDDSEQYELTALGDQFVHYAMTQLPTKITYRPQGEQFEDAPGITPESEQHLGS